MVSATRQYGVPVIRVDDQYVVGFDRPRLDKLLGATGSNRPTLGASVADASRITMKQGGIPIFGAYVGKVAAGSPGQRAGLQPGDIITEINLRSIRNAADVEEALKALQKNSQATLVWSRGNQQLRGVVTL